MRLVLLLLLALTEGCTFCHVSEPTKLGTVLRGRRADHPHLGSASGCEERHPEPGVQGREGGLIEVSTVQGTTILGYSGPR